MRKTNKETNQMTFTSQIKSPARPYQTSKDHCTCPSRKDYTLTLPDNRVVRICKHQLELYTQRFIKANNQLARRNDALNEQIKGNWVTIASQNETIEDLDHKIQALKNQVARLEAQKCSK